MARAALPRRLTWQTGAVVDLVDETTRVRTLVLRLADWSGHRAGQHVDVRLTAEDGYQAERSYSIASAPEDPQLSLTIERLDDGEVSSYLAGDLVVGDELELRGPIGGYFAWEAADGGPLLLLAGGVGIVPLRAMLRHRAAAGSDVPARLLYSARTQDEVVYRDELAQLAAGGVDVRYTLTRTAPEGWQGYRGRVDETLLQDVAFAPERRPRIYVCGPTGFVEAVASGLVALGHDPRTIRTERFGPSGSSG